MTGEVEAAGDVLTGGIIASTVDGASAGAKSGQPEIHKTCLNCGATLTGAYCVNCGQAAHLHRTLTSLGHDILHGVFHFEGKAWRTIPELFLRPGRLTRRYIDGERAKFVSPMALFLFTVFVMFAVFSFTGGALLTGEEISAERGAKALVADVQRGNATAMEETQKRIDELRTRLETPDLTPQERARLQQEMAKSEAARAAMDALSKGDLNALARLNEENDAKRDMAEAASSGASVKLPGHWTKLEARLNQGLKDINENPRLLVYKLKTNLYKFAWALIPLSVPFMWLMFFWRRDIHLYDHAIFVTYSITFMLQFLILVSFAVVIGAPGWIWGTALAFVPGIHMYKQLRGAYGLSRFGATVRLMLLSFFIVIILVLFALLLLFLGVIG